MKTFFITMCSVAILTFGSFSFAEAQATAKINLSPENPEPRSSVTLTLSSYTFDISSSFIAWRINGEQVLSGIGETVLTVRTGDIGESLTITATAQNQSGYFVEERIAITPASVAILYEAPKSHVPLFYEGRSFAATGGLVKATAIPSMSEDGVILRGESLSYTWSVNGEVLKKFSGYGKQSAEFRLDYLQDTNDVRVLVRTPKGASVSKTITISPFSIRPILYRYDEIFGTLLNAPVVSRLETTESIPLKLEPYFVSSKDDKPSTYKWLLDGFDVTPVEGTVLALVPKENSYGVRRLNVQVTGPDRRLQSAETSVEIIFDTR